MRRRDSNQYNTHCLQKHLFRIIHFTYFFFFGFQNCIFFFISHLFKQCYVASSFVLTKSHFLLSRTIFIPSNLYFEPYFKITIPFFSPYYISIRPYVISFPYGIRIGKAYENNMYPNVEAYKQIMHKHVFTNIKKKPVKVKTDWYQWSPFWCNQVIDDFKPFKDRFSWFIYLRTMFPP